MKTFTLFKRSDTGPYHFKFEFRGKKHSRSLETADAVEAQKRARALHAEITGAIIAGKYDRLDDTKVRTVHVCTLGKLLDAYRACPVDAATKTRESNINALLNVLRRVTGNDDSDALQQLPFNKLLTAENAALFFSTASKVAIESQMDEVTAKRTKNSLWSQASSLCAPRAIAYYKTLKLHHSCLDDFINAGTLHRFTRLPKLEYNPPDETIIAATLKAWEACDDRNLFLAIGHELAFGLRADEMAQARTGLWKTRHGYPVLDGEMTVKNKTGLIQVRALDPFYTIMRVKALARGWLDLSPEALASGGSPVISGSDSFRDDGIERAVSAFLRSNGWQTRKTNHALRAYAGSQVAMKYGIYDAQTWLRHSSVKVTEGHYSHFIRKFKPQNLDDLPTRWATLDTVPTITVLQQSA